MKGYVVCVYKSISNEEKLKEYAVKARAAVEKYKGKFLIFLILNNLGKLIIHFQKNFKFKIHIQIKNTLNFNPSPNKIPKAIGGENIKKRIENKLNRANDPLRKKFFLFVLLRFFKVFNSHSINL